jgi:autonomous glycyl radical cofactor GrcA
MSEKKKSVKKEVKKEVKVSGYKITKPNGNVIERDKLEDVEIKSYEAKGCKVEGV